MSADGTTDASSWGGCVGAARWLTEPLKTTLNYTTPLPVQLAVIPTIARALLSGIPMDVSLTAPTGSGKTLCYLLPMLQLVTAEKKGLNDTRLRALVLVPTKTLGQQVFSELTRLTRHTTIAAASLCGDGESMAGEADMLVRKVRAAAAGCGSALGVENGLAGGWNDSDGGNLLFSAHGVADGEHVVPNAADGEARHGDVEADIGEYTSSRGFHYFSTIDILVATPQRLLRHLDSTPGLSLAALRLLVIDEADQVLAGNFANHVVKVVERFDEEHSIRQTQEQASRRRLFPGNNSDTIAGSAGVAGAAGGHTLHKVLCSATLSSRIGRISEVRLRNCQYFALATDGTAVAQSPPTATTTTASAAAVVRTDFALPPTLQEHLVFVEDSYRHAVLLKLVRTLLLKIDMQRATKQTAAALRQQKDEDTEDEDEKEDGAKGGSVSAAKVEQLPQMGVSDYPTTDDNAGTGILVFCSSAEEARVMGHFLSAAGVRGVIEFTTLTTESERRRALLRTDTSSSSSSSAPPSVAPNVVVASDALMRGIDIPNTGHVIMYHPPESISQYVHRAGRTARAMRPGHLHVLLSKLGPSGTQADGEVAAFRKLSGMVTRTLPQVYERHFFLFAKAPVAAAPTATGPHGAGKSSGKKGSSHKNARREDSPPQDVSNAPAEEAASGAGKQESDAVDTTGTYAEWWVKEANTFLEKSQQQLRVRWASALEAGGEGDGKSKKRPRSISPKRQ